jgi:hypothetical protein
MMSAAEFASSKFITMGTLRAGSASGARRAGCTCGIASRDPV